MSLALKASLVLIIGIFSIIFLLTVVFAKHSIRSIFLCALQGICSLFAVNLIGLSCDVSLAVNWFSLGISALLGTPGVITMLIFNLIK